MLNMYETIKKALQDVVAPDLKIIHGEIKRLDEKIDSVKEEVQNMREETTQRFNVLREEMHATRDEINIRLKNMRGDFISTVNVHERLATIEAKLNR